MCMVNYVLYMFYLKYVGLYYLIEVLIEYLYKMLELNYRIYIKNINFNC